MLNEERVCEMTKVAVFDVNEEKNCKPMIQYFRGDYIARELIKSFFTGTAAFLIFAAVYCVNHAEKLLETLGQTDLQKSAEGILWIYLIFLGIYLGITYLIYNARYSKGRQKVKKYYTHLKKVNRLYYKEEHQ